MYDIIIIGAGPAGLTAAIYGTRANKKILVLEAKTYGGQIISASKIDNYPGIPHISGVEFATSLFNQAKELGAEIKFEKAINIDTSNIIKKVITNKGEYECKSIIIATGADKRKLGVEREEEFLGKGVSYCATCDGTFFKGKNVAVVGGGEAALSDTIYLSNICDKVYLIHRRDEFRGSEKAVDELREKKNVCFILNSNIVKLNGDTLLESIDIKDNNNNISTLQISALFIAVGQVPETNNLVMDLNKNKMGYIIANEDTLTNIEGVFVAGDIRQKNLRQLTTAVSDGSEAAVMACNYINSKKNSF
jgi:thioredoxin reductase (NADPH)